MKVPLEKIINNINERLFRVEVAAVESRKTLLLVLKKLDFLLQNFESLNAIESSLPDIDIDKQKKNHPLSVYIEEYFNQLMEMDDGFNTLRELERELEKYQDEITGLGES